MSAVEINSPFCCSSPCSSADSPFPGSLIRRCSSPLSTSAWDAKPSRYSLGDTAVISHFFSSRPYFTTKAATASLTSPNLVSKSLIWPIKALASLINTVFFVISSLMPSISCRFSCILWFSSASFAWYSVSASFAEGFFTSAGLDLSCRDNTSFDLSRLSDILVLYEVAFFVSSLMIWLFKSLKTARPASILVSICFALCWTSWSRLSASPRSERST